MKSTLRTVGLLLAAMAAGYVGGLLSKANRPAKEQEARKPEEIPEEIRAQKFTLVNEKGYELGALRIKMNGPALTLYDWGGKKRGEFSVDIEVPSLDLFDSSGNALGMFLVTGDEPRIYLSDATEKIIWSAP